MSIIKARILIPLELFQKLKHAQEAAQDRVAKLEAENSKLRHENEEMQSKLDKEGAGLPDVMPQAPPPPPPSNFEISPPEPDIHQELMSSEPNEPKEKIEQKDLPEEMPWYYIGPLDSP
jgi:hypothetical protein